MAKSIVQKNSDDSSWKSELRVDQFGKGSISFRGTARICGLHHSVFQKNGDYFFGAKLTEKLVDAGFDVTTFPGWKRHGIPDIAVAIIIEYYAFDAGERCTPEAIAVYRSFAAIGIRAWIQAELDWKPRSDVQKFIDNHLLRNPRDWEVVFDRQWVRAAEQCTGWKWSYQSMSKLINLVVYDRLPIEVRKVLDEYNPVLEHGHRARKQHQHFSSESVNMVLKMQIDIARSLLLVSTSWDELKENTRRRFDGMAQLKLLP